MKLSGNQRRLMAQRLGLAAREDGSSFRGFIDDQLVQGACDLIDASGVLEMAAEWHDEADKGLGGRPAALGEERDRLILVLMLVLFMTKQSPQLSEMAEIIHNRLTPASRRRLGLPVDNGRAGRRAIYFRVWRAWKRFASVCDPFPGSSQSGV